MEQKEAGSYADLDFDKCLNKRANTYKDQTRLLVGRSNTSLLMSASSHVDLAQQVKQTDARPSDESNLKAKSPRRLR